MPTLTIRDALNEALREEIIRDDNVFIMGEEVAEYDGAYKVTRGLWKEFGNKRVVDTPITELGFAALGVGAAMAGLRPVIEFMTMNFAVLASDQIINHAAKMSYMSDGQFNIPIVFRGPNGSAYQVSSQHSQAFEAFYANWPGLKVVMPATAADAKGLLKSAIRDDNPVLFLEQERMYGLKDDVPEDDDFTIPLGVADVKREGADCTVVARSMTVPLAMQAAEIAQKDLDVSVEVIDPRTIKPLDIDTIVESVKKTNRLVIAEESHAFASVGAEISHQVMENAFDYLDAPVFRISTAEAPMPYAKNLEELALPSVEKIIEGIKTVSYI
ncbi:MAG: pyruvate dehydrogenase complex E1 component subunit beta [Pyrinomonadaceae bacterium]|nr:pyruvate dehydrogenase complex E1 component subunit beta [Pyrinomonadaceae bacterium]